MQVQLYARMLQRGWWIIALTALSALVVALLVSYMTVPVYSTNTRFIISPNLEQGANGALLINSISALDKRSIASTFAEVLDSENVYKQASAEINIDPAVLRTYKISTVVLPDANVLELSASGSDPQIAALLANTVGQKGISYVTSLYPVYSVDVLDPAVPSSVATSPNPRRDMSLALVVGVVLGIALVFAREQLRLAPGAAQKQADAETQAPTYKQGHPAATGDAGTV